MGPIQPRNPNLLSRLQPFVVATEENRPRFDLAPFGLSVSALYDPLHTDATLFLERLKRLDEVTFGPEGMPMPRWMFFDGAELPGGIVGFGAAPDDLPDEVSEVLGLDRTPRRAQGEALSDDFVPLSMFIAIPTPEVGTWMGHNLCSLGPLVTHLDLKGLASLTKAVGLEVFRATGQVGVTQWNSLALAVHTRLGPLELLTAWTPAHSEPWSLTYRATLTEGSLRNLARDPRGEVPEIAPERWIDSRDHDAMQALQREIEAGARYAIVGRPRIHDPEHLDVPVARLPASVPRATSQP